MIFPFIIVQLPPIGAPTANPQQSAWSELREAQRLTAMTGKNIGLAVLTDISDESVLHPTKKEPVGVRVALVAQGLAYRDKGEYMGPAYERDKDRPRQYYCALQARRGSLFNWRRQGLSSRRN